VSDWTQMVGKGLVAILALLSVWFLLRGHNAPGGGFIGGVLLGLGLFLRTITLGRSSRPVELTSLGLLIGYSSALFPGFFGTFFQSFLLPGTPSSLFFDIGVYLTVSGVISGFIELLLR